MKQNSIRKLICSKCQEVFQNHYSECKKCGTESYDFSNNDIFLLNEARRVQSVRTELGLEGLVGGLQCIIINTESDRQKEAIKEILNYTGFEFKQAFEDSQVRMAVLGTEGSADILVQSRKEENPFSNRKFYCGRVCLDSFWISS